jgi:hypothetical protein
VLRDARVKTRIRARAGVGRRPRLRDCVRPVAATHGGSIGVEIVAASLTDGWSSAGFDPAASQTCACKFCVVASVPAAPNAALCGCASAEHVTPVAEARRVLGDDSTLRSSRSIHELAVADVLDIVVNRAGSALV